MASDKRKTSFEGATTRRDPSFKRPKLGISTAKSKPPKAEKIDQLPPEVVSSITAKLDIVSLFSFRLASRRLKELAEYTFGEVFERQNTFYFDAPSLNQLIDIASSPYATLVKTVCVDPSFVYTCWPSPGRPDAKYSDEDAAKINNFLDDQQYMRHSGAPSQLLPQALAKLPNCRTVELSYYGAKKELGRTIIQRLFNQEGTVAPCFEGLTNGAEGMLYIAPSNEDGEYDAGFEGSLAGTLASIVTSRTIVTNLILHLFQFRDHTSLHIPSHLDIQYSDILAQLEDVTIGLPRAVVTEPKWFLKLKDFFARTTHLRILELQQQVTRGDISSQMATLSIPSLQTLKLRGFHFIETIGLITAMKGLGPSLKELSLTSITFERASVTDAAKLAELGEICQAADSIEFISFQYQRNIEGRMSPWDMEARFGRSGREDTMGLPKNTIKFEGKEDTASPLKSGQFFINFPANPLGRWD